jgi:eukaryotic-like serine/threonine-protein kinase
MLSEVTDRALQIQRTLEMLDLQGATVVANPRASLAPATEPVGAERADSVLAKLRGGAERFVFGERIGEGGMGVVHVATQVALGRVVAVKRVRDGGAGTKEARALVAEALITGSLEHPNVIPVYEMAVDAEGSPILAMKRIEGEPWSRLLHDADAVRARSPSEPLVFHLKVFCDVCDAVHFAHSRGVLHRDIKPDNVLIGHFGEVYLADWGIACSPGRVTRICGTPAYMAPEMLICEEISERTDVYLLGAVLFELLTGDPPHRGATSQALLASILVSEVSVPPSVPAELADLLNACLSRDPAARPESAHAVRLRIDAFLEHRGSTALAARADLLATELAAKIASDAARASVYETFTECRFAYREALRSWPENAHARAALRAVVERMLDREIASGDLAAAKLLAAELAELSPETRTALAALEQSQQVAAERMERLSRLEHELDPRVGRGARLGLGITIGLMWTLLPLAGYSVGIRFGQLETIVSLPVTILVVAAFALTGKLAGWRASQLNRRLVRAFAFVLVVQAVSACVLYAMHVPNRYVGRGMFFYWFLAIGIVSASLEWRLLPAALAYLAGFAIVMEWPATRYACATIVNFSFTVFIALVWIRGRARP